MAREQNLRQEVAVRVCVCAWKDVPVHAVPPSCGLGSWEVLQKFYTKTLGKNECFEFINVSSSYDMKQLNHISHSSLTTGNLTESTV